MMKKITTLGEIMLRLSPLDRQQPLLATKGLGMGFAGAESTVAINVSHWGIPSKYITSLPDNDIGRAAINNLREYGVDVSEIQKSNRYRMGTFFIEYGASIRPSKVLYDRKESAISRAAIGSFDWNHILRDTKILFTSGITPALSNNCLEIGLAAFRKAKELGITTCFDLNYRRTLWNNSEAKAAFDKYLDLTDIVFANEGVFDDIYGITATAGKGLDATWHAGQQFLEKWPRVNALGMTSRTHQGGQQVKWSGLFYNSKNVFYAPEFQFEIIERLGSGDAFSAGLLYSIYHNLEGQEAIDYAIAASALKHTILGDICLVSEQDIRETATGKLSPYIKR